MRDEPQLDGRDNALWREGSRFNCEGKIWIPGETRKNFARDVEKPLPIRNSMVFHSSNAVSPKSLYIWKHIYKKYALADRATILWNQKQANISW